MGVRYKFRQFFAFYLGSDSQGQKCKTREDEIPTTDENEMGWEQVRDLVANAMAEQQAVATKKVAEGEQKNETGTDLWVMSPTLTFQHGGSFSPFLRLGWRVLADFWACLGDRCSCCAYSRSQNARLFTASRSLNIQF